MARFDSLRYPIHKLSPQETVEQIFPDLFKSPEFKKIRGNKEHDKIARYIIYLYDKNTDLTHEFQNNLQARKDAAAREAGFTRTADKWPALVVAIMTLQDKDVLAAIFRWLKDQKHNIWTEIVVTEQELEEFQRLRFNPITKAKGKQAKDESTVLKAANEKDKLLAACTSRIERLESLYSQFFADHSDVKAEYEEQITPENASRILAKMAEDEQKTETPAEAAIPT